MISITKEQIWKLSSQIEKHDVDSDKTPFTIIQHHRGAEETCDHISVEGPFGSFRLDPEGNMFDIQLKDTPT